MYFLLNLLTRDLRHIFMNRIFIQLILTLAQLKKHKESFLVKHYFRQVKLSIMRGRGAPWTRGMYGPRG